MIDIDLLTETEKDLIHLLAERFEAGHEAVTSQEIVERFGITGRECTVARQTMLTLGVATAFIRDVDSQWCLEPTIEAVHCSRRLKEPPDRVEQFQRGWRQSRVRAGVKLMFTAFASAFGILGVAIALVRGCQSNNISP